MAVQIKVRGYHLDVYNHVNNSRYLEFLEESRWEYLGDNAVVKSLMDMGLAMVVVNININYRQPALLNDVLEDTTAIECTGNKSAAFAQQILKIDDHGQRHLVADASVTFCVMDHKTQKAVIIEGATRNALEQLQDDLSSSQDNTEVNP